MRSLSRLPALTTLLVVSLASAAPAPRVKPRSPETSVFRLPLQQDDSVFSREFYFTRGIYSSYYGCGPDSRGGYGRRGCSWAVDYPKADRQFLVGVRRLLNIDAYEMDHAVSLLDPDLGRFPFLYMLEVGRMELSDAEVAAIRRYSAAGGFIVIDDFWGSWEWQNWEAQVQQIFPEYPIVEIPMEHPIFNMVYPIKEILQVPNVGNAHAGRTVEQDGIVPHCRGIFDKNGRLLVVINWNTDMGDAWEWAEDPYYPLKYSTFAWEMGINFIVYAMSH